MFILEPGRILRVTSSGKRKVEWAVDNIKHFIITSQRATSLFGACLVKVLFLSVNNFGSYKSGAVDTRYNMLITCMDEEATFLSVYFKLRQKKRQVSRNYPPVFII